MRANVKPFVHWAIYKGYTVRYTDRSPAQVAGILTTPEGEQAFRFDPTNLIITMADRRITINPHGWELSQDAQTAGHDNADHDAAEDATDHPDSPGDQR